jgi:hypothetical protein
MPDSCSSAHTIYPQSFFTIRNIDAAIHTKTVYGGGDAYRIVPIHRGRHNKQHYKQQPVITFSACSRRP